MNKLEVCIEEVVQPTPMFWFLTVDEQTINCTPKMARQCPNLYEGLIILNDKDVIPEEMTTNTLFVIQDAIAMIKQKQEIELYSTSFEVKPNEQYIKAISYLEKAIEIANDYDNEIEETKESVKK